MEIRYHRNFLKSYRKRIKPNSRLDIQFKERISLFKENPKNPLLKDHRLTGGKRQYHSFSVTGDVRVIYQKLADIIILYDIGTHNQVY